MESNDNDLPSGGSYHPNLNYTWEESDTNGQPIYYAPNASFVGKPKAGTYLYRDQRMPDYTDFWVVSIQLLGLCINVK